MSEKENSFSRLWQQGKDYATLKIEYAKLTAAEKLSVLLSAVAVAFVVFSLAMVALIFLSVALAEWLGQSIGMAWGCGIVAVVYIAMMVLLFLLRKPLFINPVSRFVSRLILS